MYFSGIIKAKTESEQTSKSKYSKSTKRGRKKKRESKVTMGAPKEKEVTENHFNPNYLFDYLVSPIKVDYEFGPIKNPITSRAVVIERNRDF